MLALWGRLTSINVQKVAWVLAETSLPFERNDVGGAFGGLDTPEYRAMNPSGKIPTLQDNAFTLWESNAICRYLVDAYQGPLAEPTASKRAEADMWMEWFQNGPYIPFIKMFYQTVRLPQNQRQPDALAHALDQLNKHFAVAEAALDGKKYLLGDSLSLADIPFAACLYRYFTLEIDRPTIPRIDDYYARLTERPAYQNAVMIDYESLRPVD